MIYIVDDDESVRRNLSRLMRSAGFCARTFASAEEILACADHLEPGCLLLDITLPGLSGLQLQAELNHRQVCLPIIAISARDDADTCNMARLLGAHCFFHKPVDDQALLDAIRWVQPPETHAAAPQKQPANQTKRFLASGSTEAEDEANQPIVKH